MQNATVSSKLLKIIRLNALKVAPKYFKAL